MCVAASYRDYIDQLLPAFSQGHPHVQVAMVLRRNHFPFVKAEYGESMTGHTME